MKNILFNIYLIASVFLSSCTENIVSDKEVEQKAFAVIKSIDQNIIDTFRHWGYSTRGKAEIWSKLDTPLYNCFYLVNGTQEIHVWQIENFKIDFPFTLNVDTNFISRLIFKKLTDNKIKVDAIGKLGRDTVINEAIDISKLFQVNNPFDYFSRLSELKNSLGIIETFYSSELGNFIEFHLTNEYVLTYLPDTLQVDPQFKNVWISEFSTGKNLSKNWNLRKLKKPSDKT
jgi:hypothetical protein